MRYESEMFMKKLKKDSSVALYQQLINEIKESIQAGELKPGDRLMTEGEFSKEYDVSRITVRKAIEVLVEEGILIKKQGIGTFVADKKLIRDASFSWVLLRVAVRTARFPVADFYQQIFQRLPGWIREI